MPPFHRAGAKIDPGRARRRAGTWRENPKPVAEGIDHVASMSLIWRPAREHARGRRRGPNILIKTIIPAPARRPPGSQGGPSRPAAHRRWAPRDGCAWAWIMANIPPGTRRPGVAKGIHRGGKSGREGGRIGPKSLLLPPPAGASGRRAENRPGVTMASFSTAPARPGRAIGSSPSGARVGPFFLHGFDGGVGVMASFGIGPRSGYFKTGPPTTQRLATCKTRPRSSEADPRKTVGMQKTRLDPMSVGIHRSLPAWLRCQGRRTAPHRSSRGHPQNPKILNKTVT